MKSIKPGRYNSGQNLLGSIIGIVFMIFWIDTAIKMGAPIIFPVVGAGMLLMLVSEFYKNLHNIKNKNRYSEFDIVDEKEEPDPWNEKYSRDTEGYGGYIQADFENGPYEDDSEYGEMIYCPHCGAKLMGDFDYCHKCGKKLPV